MSTFENILFSGSAFEEKSGNRDHSKDSGISTISNARLVLAI